MSETTPQFTCACCGDSLGKSGPLCEACLSRVAKSISPLSRKDAIYVLTVLGLIRPREAPSLPGLEVAILAERERCANVAADMKIPNSVPSSFRLSLGPIWNEVARTIAQEIRSKR